MALDRRGKDKLAEELEHNNYFEGLVRQKIHIEDKHKYRNLRRCMQHQRKEREEEDRAYNAKYIAAYKEKETEQEENLARAMEKLKRDETNALRERQMLRQMCPELKELESKLRAAYVCKEQHAQMAEKEATKMQAKIKLKCESQKMSEARYSEEEWKKKQYYDDMMKKYNYRVELQDQMILNEKARRCKYEEFMRDKKMIDDIVYRIHLEDERALEEKLCRMLKTREEMEQFKKAQEIWRKKERDALEQENLKIQEYLRTKVAGLKEQAEAKKRLEDAKAAISDKIAKQIYEETAKRKERENILQELLEEEKREAEEQRHVNDLERQLRLRLETAAVLDKQVIEREEKIKADIEEDKQWRQAMLEKLAEENKVEQLTAQKKRIKMIELRKDVEEMMKQRRQKRAEELQLLTELQRQEEMEAEERKQKIERERLRMLKEHAQNLIGYLPRGVLREDDFKELGTELAEAYRPMKPA